MNNTAKTGPNDAYKRWQLIRDESRHQRRMGETHALNNDGGKRHHAQQPSRLRKLDIL